MMEGTADDAISMGELAQRGEGRDDAEWEQRWSSVTPDDICTIIYTSGTTGPPKGCVISHGNYRSMLTMSSPRNVLEDGETVYLFLPLAHSFALLIQLRSFDLGGNIAYWERDPLKIVPNLSEVKPTSSRRCRASSRRSTPPRPPTPPRAPRRGSSTGPSASARRSASASAPARTIGFLLKRQYKLADKLVLSKIRALFGGNLRVCVTGAAPINPEILRFFDAAGVLILEGWGMTETSTAATIARPEAFKFGTVGRAFKDCEIKIADDGEILVKGPNVFQGYYKNPEATAETIVDGWLHTGDIGELDSDGYLKITGRKKDIIITAGGKNITPANLEAEIKQSRWISQCVVIGDRRPVPDRPGDARPRGDREARRGEGLAQRPRRDRQAARDARADLRAHGRDQQEVRPGRADQEVRDPARRPLAGGRRADPDAEGEAQRGRRQVRAEIEALYG